MEKGSSVQRDSPTVMGTVRHGRPYMKGAGFMYRNQTKEIAIGSVKIGGDNPVAIQSMTNTKTEDAEATIEQILKREAAG